ncbi:AAA family ATPase [Rhodococcus sp. AQ5-07]|uniref:AAA family ATPase n=1 Tax=Rhodococcus sp. AQ5-07 TaxID=2054902 RepID=UPI000DC02AD2|nr:ATP-binding protein [Rhodococcus sp. AQ5-07]RAL31798.1 hypothetical protein CVN56_27015 [Rhodococcus sp. AQ5-07]
MIERIVVRGYRLFQDFEMVPTTGLNIVVGGNEAGKSTLLEAISLGLTGRVDGCWAEEQINPYWFNQQLVANYFAELAAGNFPKAPEILIELFLSPANPDIRILRGVYNSCTEDVPGPRTLVGALRWRSNSVKNESNIRLVTKCKHCQSTSA